MLLCVYMSFYYTNTYMNLTGKRIVSTYIFDQISGGLETPQKKGACMSHLACMHVVVCILVAAD
jgi:hypothetical protein